jgi:hypothetical protein
VLLQDPDDLRLRETTALHAMVLALTRANVKLDQTCGATSSQTNSSGVLTIFGSFFIIGNPSDGEKKPWLMMMKA